MSESFEEVIDSGRQAPLDLKELWRYRELFYFLTWRDIKIKYKQTVLGFLWAVLQPLMLMVIFTLFFGKALQIPSQKLPYPVFVFSGLLLWNLFSSGVTASSTSMVNNAQIIKKIYFPRLIIPVSSVLVALFDFLMGFCLLIFLLLYYRQPVSTSWLWCWPAAVVVCVVATLGPGSLLSALNVKYRDFRYIIPFLIQVLFFLAPVIYPVSLLKYPALKYVVAMSPIYAAVELFRYPLTGVPLDMPLVVTSLASGIVLFFAGVIYFKRSEALFADFA